MRIRTITLITLLLVVFAASTVFAYTGTLTTSNGMTGTGDWINDSGKPGWQSATLSWTINLTSPGVWHYEYTMDVSKGEVSHFILQVSPNFTMQNIWNASGKFNGMELKDYSLAPSNPNMPGTIHGIKFDNAWGETFTLSFDSDRMPVWGDFYSKSGQSTAWNLGLTNPDTDPTVPAADGVYNNHILVPDSVSNIVPEPSGVIAFASGLMGLAGFVTRKRR